MATGKTRLRQFLYRDGSLIREFLAQIEGGIFEEESTKTSRGKSSGLGGGAGIGPARVEGKRGSERAEETERVTQQTEASEFARLFDSLQSSDAITLIESAHDKSWADLRRGDLVEIEAAIRQSGVSKFFELAENLTNLAPLLRAAADEGESLSWLDDLEQMGQIGLKRGGTLTVVAAVATSPDYEFAFDLTTDLLLVGSDRIEGEATVMGKVLRKLKEGERYAPLGEVFKGLEKLLPEKDLNEFLALFDNPEMAALGVTRPEVQAPGAILLPLAIYR